MKRTAKHIRGLLYVVAPLLCLGLAACERPEEDGLSDGTPYLPDPEVLERVQNTLLEVVEPGGLRFGTATLQERAGSMRVVRLTGPTPYELGYQHGILLRDSIPEVARERGVGNVVCGSPNVTSVVFLPARGFFWVASGGSGIPSCKNEYLGYDFWAELNGDAPAVMPVSLPGYAWSEDSHRAGQEAYLQAELAYQVDKTDVDTILGHLAAARAADPEEPKYYRAEARYLLRRGLDPATANTADQEAGIERLEQSLDESIVGAQANNERALSLLYLGRALDLTGNRQGALDCYSGILSLLRAHGWRSFPSGLNKVLAIEALMGTMSPYTGTFAEGFALSIYE